jgi:hypothetical protein
MAIVAGATLGLIAVGMGASPASAHEAFVGGKANCDTSSGQYVVQWTITNDYGDDAVRGRVNALPEGTIVDLDREIPGNSSITGIQRVPGNSRFAGIELEQVSWEDGHVQRRGLDKTISLPGNCSNTKPPAPPKPPAQPKPNPGCVAPADAEFSHKFDGAKGTATVSLDGDKPLCRGGDQGFALASYTSSKAPGAQLKKFDSADGVISPQKKSIDLKVDLPPCYLKVYLVWDKGVINPITATDKYGDRILGSVGKPGSLSKGSIGLFEGGTADCDSKPSVTFENTCDNVTITLINDGTLPVQFNGFTKIGDGAFQPVPKPITVDPGKKATFAVEPVQPGLSVKVTSGAFTQEHSWAAPEECAAPSPSEGTATPSPGSGGGLPVTGAGLGGLIAAALVATGLGAALVVLARRRRRVA